MTENYLGTIYNGKERPVTAYPDQLAAYLIKRFHIRKGARLLDIGCGRGGFLLGFRKKGINAIEIDGAERTDEHFIGGINLETDDGIETARQLRGYLIDSQYGLCAYCCREISLENSLNEQAYQTTEHGVLQKTVNGIQ